MDFIPQLSLPVWIEAIIYIGAIVVAYIVGKIREKKNRKRIEKKNNNINWEVHSQIHEFLTELRVKVHAGRAQIIQFHNGEYFIDGISMHKMSTTHESLKNGLSSDAKKLLLVTMFSALMEKIEKNEPYLYKTSEEKPSYFKNTLDLGNVDYFMALPLFYGGAKSGFIMLEWCDEEDNRFAIENVTDIQLELLYIRNIIQTRLSQQVKVDK
jgi:hypothetical protein